MLRQSPRVSIGGCVDRSSSRGSPMRPIANRMGASMVGARNGRWKEALPPAARDFLRMKVRGINPAQRSEEHTSELQSLMRISYAVFCLKKKQHNTTKHSRVQHTKIQISD